ncbi:unnamed protein product [Ectocarpus fasciculatus]
MKSWSGTKLGARQRLAFALFCGTSMCGLQDVAAADDFDGSSYARNVSLDTNVDIFWTIDLEAETIRLAVHAKAASGWAGVGISEMGGMEGADIVYYEAATGNVTDAHSLVAGTPVVDECTQDWTLLSADVGSGSLVFEAERALDTGDAQDRVFEDDSLGATRLLAAWGESDSVGYHAGNFAKGDVVMFGGSENADAAEPLDEVKATVSFFDATSKNFSIPTERTWYEHTCITASELPNLDEYHVIGFEGILQDDTAEFVHHLVLTGFYGPPDCGNACAEWMDEMFGDDGSSYSSSDITNITLPWFCNDIEEAADIFVWAPGMLSAELPDDVGFLFGNESGGLNSLRVQTHYNNPDGVSGMNDSSGVRVYYTEELRPMHMGLVKLGDPHGALHPQPLPDGKSVYTFGCPGTCTDTYFEEEEVTVFSHLFHMHENGQRMLTRQYRSDSDGNEVLVHAAEVEYYSFEQAGVHMVTVNDSTIKKGDVFTTECFYDTSYSSVGSPNVTWGLGSENEMCIDFVYYYPDQRLPNRGACGSFSCNGTMLSYSELEDDSDFNRTFGVVDTCTASEGVQEEELTSSSRATVPLLGLLAISTTMALVLEAIMV